MALGSSRHKGMGMPAPTKARASGLSRGCAVWAVLAALVSYGVRQAECAHESFPEDAHIAHQSEGFLSGSPATFNAPRTPCVFRDGQRSPNIIIIGYPAPGFTKGKVGPRLRPLS